MIDLYSDNDYGYAQPMEVASYDSSKEVTQERNTDKTWGEAIADKLTGSNTQSDNTKTTDKERHGDGTETIRTHETTEKIVNR